MTRYADECAATVWVETSGPCEVQVLGRTARTFAVEGHHYALVVLEGLDPATDEAYDVRLDGRVVWPAPDDSRPAPRLRTLPPQGPRRVVVGSCRVDRPHEPPYTLQPAEHRLGVGVDALVELSRQCQRGDRPLPDLLMLVGDQVYADEGVSPRIRQRQVEKRGAASEPRDGVADFEEYTWLYRDSWQDPDTRWLLSTVPSAMIFDDHEVNDDWNTSEAWLRHMSTVPWWPERLTGAYMSYWIYQHLGNESPAAIAEEGLLAGMLEDGDAGRRLRRFAELADEERGGEKLSRWSYVRQLGDVRLVVIDTRSGRDLQDGRRSMLSEPEWRYLEDNLTGGCEHLLVASSLPLVLGHGLHDLERWDEAVAEGAWGRRARGLGERIRQELDLEHWAAFRTSFDRLTRRLGEVARGRHGAAPSSVLILSGDVHHSYVAPLRYPDAPADAAPVVQVVSSPMRNAYPRHVRRMLAATHSRAAALVGRVLARSVRLPRPDVEWACTSGPFYENCLTTLELSRGEVTVHLEQAVRRQGVPRLETNAISTFPRHG